MRRAVLLVLAVLFALPVLSACNDDLDPMARDFMAYDACKDAVSQQLKAPSTADFQSETDVAYDESGGGEISIAGYVDAENGFGAKLRVQFICTENVDKQGNATNVSAELEPGA